MADPVEVSPGTWLARIFINRHPTTGALIRHRADRRFEAVGKRRAIAIARQKEAEVRAELAAAHLARTPTVAQAAESWWDLWVERNRSPTTRRSYRSILDNHILTAPFADHLVTKVTTDEIERWYSRLAAAGTRKVQVKQRVKYGDARRPRATIAQMKTRQLSALGLSSKVDRQLNKLGFESVFDMRGVDLTELGLNPIDIDQLRAALAAARGTPGGKRPPQWEIVEVVEPVEGLEPSTVRRVHAVLTQVFRQMVRGNVLPRNPAEDAYKPEIRSKGKTLVPVGTINLLLAAAARRAPIRAEALAFAALTGLRRGEMCGIRHSVVDLDDDSGGGILTVSNAVIVARPEHVGRSAQPVARGLATKGPKAHQVAAIALGVQAATIARRRIAEQDGASGDPYLWSVEEPYTVPLSPDMLTRWFSQAAKDAGVRGFTLHDLRHWQGSQMLEVGATIQDVKERLRHKSVQTTAGYLHADHSKQRVLIDLMPQLELGPPA